MFKRTLVLCGFTLLSATLIPSLTPGREQTKSPALSAPVRLPNQAPEPGKRLFQLLDSPLDGGGNPCCAGYRTPLVCSMAGIAVVTLL